MLGADTARHGFWEGLGDSVCFGTQKVLGSISGISS